MNTEKYQSLAVPLALLMFSGMRRDELRGNKDKTPLPTHFQALKDKDVVVFAQADEPGVTGAQSWVTELPESTKIFIPDTAGKDWADILNVHTPTEARETLQQFTPFTREQFYLLIHPLIQYHQYQQLITQTWMFPLCSGCTRPFNNCRAGALLPSWYGKE